MPTLVAGVNNQIWLCLCNHSCKGAAMILGDRIKNLLDQRGLSQSALARAIGVSPQAINKLVSGSASNSVHLYKIAQFLGCTPEYLTGDSDEVGAGTGKTDGAIAVARPTFEDMATERGLIPIRHLDLAFGMGATYLDNPVEEEMRFFPEAFIRSFTKAPPAMIYFAEGAGDSMMPTIHSNDVVIIDTSVRRITMGDQIWACNYAGLGMIKRLRPMPDGGVKILSDNPSVPVETAYDGELSLVGRIVGVARKI